MDKFTHLAEFVGYLFDDEAEVDKAKRIVEGILKARSPRLSEIAREMTGGEAANYKCIQRFLQESEPQSSLLRRFQEEADFVIGDPTEMPRPQAKRTEYVGKLSDGQTSGYWLLFLATPYQGRAISVSFCELLIGDDRGRSQLPKPLPLPGLCPGEATVGRQAAGVGS